MATLVFFDDYLREVDARPRFDSSVIPRVGDWVQIPTIEDEVHLVSMVTIHYSEDGDAEVWVTLKDSRSIH